MSLDIKLMCRTCEYSDNPPGTLMPLTSELAAGISLADAIMACAPVKVTESDGLPQKICLQCADSLRVAHTFQKQCVRAQNTLKQLLSSEKTCTENDVKIDLPVMKTGTSDHEDNYINLVDDETSNDEEEKSLNKGKNKIVPTSNTKIAKPSQSHFKCGICEKVYLNPSNYEKHIKSHKQNKSHKCNVCKKKFLSEKSMREHEHSGPCPGSQQVKVKSKDEIKCAKCNKIFKNVKAFLLHKEKHKKLKICQICDKEFYSNAQLKRHLQSSHGLELWKCGSCERKFATQAERERHEARHRKRNTCPFCNKCFSQMCNLKDHVRTHTGEISFLCAECGKGFNNSSNLRQHMSRHSGLKPFACSQCPNTFPTKGQMKSHESTHSGERPYACELCAATFTKFNSLKKHKLIHLGIKRYQCDVCERRFTSSDHLKRHNRIHTGEKPYACTYCSRAFTQSNDLTKHLRGHVGQNLYECTVCSLRFRLLAELKHHYPIHYVNGKLPTNNQNNDRLATEDPHTVEHVQSTTPQLNNKVGLTVSANATVPQEKRFKGGGKDKSSNVNLNEDAREVVVIEE